MRSALPGPYARASFMHLHTQRMRKRQEGAAAFLPAACAKKQPLCAPPVGGICAARPARRRPPAGLRPFLPLRCAFLCAGLQRAERLGVCFALQHGEARKCGAQALRQNRHNDALGGVMGADDAGEPRLQRVQCVVVAHFAGDESVAARGLRLGPQLVACAGNDARADLR